MLLINAGKGAKPAMSKKVIPIVLTVCLLSSLLSGCYDRAEIDDLTYVIAIGMDKGKIEPLKLTLQYAVPKAMGEGGGGGGGGGGGEGGPKALEQLTLECPTLVSGLNMANGFVGKQINLSHAVAMFISDELAKEGIGKFIYALNRSREARPNIFVSVCRGPAEDYLKTVKPIQEIDPSKYYELLFSTYRHTAFIPNIQFAEFYNDLMTPGSQPVAVLTGLSEYKTSKEFDPGKSTAKEKGKPVPLEGDFLAGEIPKVGEPKAEVMGLAIFDGDRMVGELDGASATNYLMVTGDFKSAYVSIPDPKSPDKYVVLNVSQRTKPKRKVELTDGKPKNSVDISLEASFVSIQSGTNYEDTNMTPLIEKAASDLFHKGITTFLNRTAKEFKSDVSGFGKEVARQFLTWQEWQDFKWLDRYKDSTFEVSIKVKIRRSGILIHSSPFTSTQGSENKQ